jgi:hypothetical protein
MFQLLFFVITQKMKIFPPQTRIDPTFRENCHEEVGSMSESRISSKAKYGETVNNKSSPFLKSSESMRRGRGWADTYRSLYKHNKSFLFFEGCQSNISGLVNSPASSYFSPFDCAFASFFSVPSFGE